MFYVMYFRCLQKLYSATQKIRIGQKGKWKLFNARYAHILTQKDVFAKFVHYLRNIYCLNA